MCEKITNERKKNHARKISTRDNVLVYYQENDLQPGVIVGTNADTGNDNLLYTVKVGNRYWVGKETRLFPQYSS